MKLYHYILAILIVFSLQFTDLKFYDLKIGDLVSIISCFFVIFIFQYIRFPKFYVRLLFIFTVLIINSIIVLLYIKFYPPSNLSILKKPGILSLSRYVQYVGCVFFSFFIYYFFSTNNIKFNQKFYLFIDKLMIIISIFYFIIFILSLIGIESPFIYSDHRLKGGYVEGGPFGLFMTYYVIFRYLVTKKLDIYNLLFMLLILISQSKAAIIFLILFYFIYLFIEKKINIRQIICVLIPSVILLIIANQYFNLSNRLQIYFDDYKNLEYQVMLREEDPSLIMGRIAAAHIAPNIIKDNLLLGVGLGNYSLVRNNPKYLDGLPKVSDWDLSGLGGVYNILIESGVLGVILFLIPFIYLWIKFNNNMIKYGILLFFTVQICGVQTYFQYIWFGLGLFYYLGSKNKLSLFDE